MRNQFGKLNAKGVKTSPIVDLETEHTVCRITKTNFVEDPRCMYDSEDGYHGLLRTFVSPDLYVCNEIPDSMQTDELISMCDAYKMMDFARIEEYGGICIPIYMVDDGSCYSMNKNRLNDHYELFGVIYYSLEFLRGWADSLYCVYDYDVKDLYNLANRMYDDELPCLISYANCIGYQYYVFDKTWKDGTDDDEEAYTGTTYVLESVDFYLDFIDDERHRAELEKAFYETK